MTFFIVIFFLLDVIDSAKFFRYVELGKKYKERNLRAICNLFYIFEASFVP